MTAILTRIASCLRRNVSVKRATTIHATKIDLIATEAAEMTGSVIGEIEETHYLLSATATETIESVAAETVEEANSN